MAIAARTVLEVGAWLFLTGLSYNFIPFKTRCFRDQASILGKKDLGKERQVLPRQLTGSKLIVSLMSARNL